MNQLLTSKVTQKATQTIILSGISHVSIPNYMKCK